MWWKKRNFVVKWLVCVWWKKRNFVVKWLVYVWCSKISFIPRLSPQEPGNETRHILLLGAHFCGDMSLGA